MIQFNEQELSKIEDELYEALNHLEEACDHEGDNSVNLLRVGQENGQAIQILKRVNDIIGGKLRESKLRSSTEDAALASMARSHCEKYHPGVPVLEYILQ